MPVIIIHSKPPEKHSLFTKIGVNSRYLTVLCLFMQVIDIIKVLKPTISLKNIKFNDIKGLASA